jgi:G3E family GTPase
MNPPSLSHSPPLTAPRTARLILVGGFLGAGKTTALQALARALTQSGHAVGCITNDQAPDLVDTHTLGRLSLPIAEVAGGCFCCRFDDLIARAQHVLASAPDVLLCEPVGSCTDMAATVLAPLRRDYAHAFVLAPFTVLVDPERLDALATLPSSVRYLFEKQLEEADAIVLSKVDTLPQTRRDEIRERLAARWNKPVLSLSAQEGEGLAAWSTLLFEGTSAVRALATIDYDLYAAGEAELGWLNATAQLHAPVPIEAKALAHDLMARLRAAFRSADAPIAHLKLSLSDETTWVRANVTRTDGPIALETAGPGTMTAARLVINARVGIAPETLQAVVETTLAAAAQRARSRVELRTLQAFRPGYPTPPYRIAAG